MNSIKGLFTWKRTLIVSIVVLFLLNIFSFYGLYTNKFYFFKFHFLRKWRIKKGTTIDLIPEVRTIDQSIQINIQNTLQEDGFYSLTNGVVEKTVSYNFDREESNLTTWGLDELEEISEQYAHINVWYKEGLQLENALKENRSGTPLWRIFILLALLLIFIESLLLKNWKKKAQINLEN